MEVEGEAERSVVEFGEKRMEKKEQTSHRKRKPRRKEENDTKIFQRKEVEREK